MIHPEEKEIFSLDDISQDERLARLFKGKDKNCVIQLWILQIKQKEQKKVVSHIIYGRIFPYSYANQKWSATSNPKRIIIEDNEIKLIQVNLYYQNKDTRLLIESLESQYSLSEISKKIGFEFSDKLEQEIGNVKISYPVIYRPVMYLFNKDAHLINSLSSPHHSAGSYSAALIQSQKKELFQIDGDYCQELIKFIITELNAMTGLQFRKQDYRRLGDIELLVFPTLDDHEKELLNVMFNKEIIKVQFDTQQLPFYRSFYINFTLLNDDQIIHSTLNKMDKQTDHIFRSEMSIAKKMGVIVDSLEIKIYGQKKENTELVLCTIWQNHYICEISLNIMSSFNEGNNKIQSDWLEKIIQQKDAKIRLNLVQTIKNNYKPEPTIIGGRQTDSWVTINKHLLKLLEKIDPRPSQGMFFEKIGDSNGLARLEFVEWLRKILETKRNSQVFLFDPYFDSAGISLLALNMKHECEYTVFISLPDNNNKKNEDEDRIKRLLSSCEKLDFSIGNQKLKIYNIEKGSLHDRYLLIMAGNRLVSGFHLSNSIQHASENYPLLITPIPSDTLIKVGNYVESLLEKSNLQLLFDSQKHTSASNLLIKQEEQLFDNKWAGHILADCIKEESLRTLTGLKLKNRLEEIRVLKGISIKTDILQGIQQYLSSLNNDSTYFYEKWCALSDIFASSFTDNNINQLELYDKQQFIEQLVIFLKNNYKKIYTPTDPNKKVTIEIDSIIKEPFEKLLQSSKRIEHFRYQIKFSFLTWADVFAIKILWQFSPERLIDVLDSIMEIIQKTNRDDYIFPHAILIQSLGEISLSAQIRITNKQLNALLDSDYPLFKWMGLNVFKFRLEKDSDLQEFRRYVGQVNLIEKVQIIGWFLVKTGIRTSHIQSQIFYELLALLFEILPTKLEEEQTILLINSLRQNMTKISYSEPWISDNIIMPLLEQERISANGLSKIWLQDLLSDLNGYLVNQTIFFQKEVEGNLTLMAAFLFSQSDYSQQIISLQPFQQIIKKCKRKILKPLASTVDWKKWNNALAIIFWIKSFLELVVFYLDKPNNIEDVILLLKQELEELIFQKLILEHQDEQSIYFYIMDFMKGIIDNKENLR